MIHWQQSLHHDGSALFVVPQAPQIGQQISIRLRMDAGAPVVQVFLRHTPDGEQELVPMTPEPGANVARIWTAQIALHQPVLDYHFLILSKGGVWWFNGKGVHNHQPLDQDNFRIPAGQSGPAWLVDAVFYQIFPDTFRMGDPALKPGDPQGQPPPQLHPWEAEVAEELPFHNQFFGGDLRGVRQSLDYIADLGANALYLNPLFRAPSNHRYDVTDYLQVDPGLGGDDALIALRRDLDQREMRYLLDIVPNHCGEHHPWFRRAQEDPEAREAAFFTFHAHPHDYESWLSFKNLVKLNYRSDLLMERMITGTDAVFRYWLKPPFRADGWRVDVGNMLGRQGQIQMNAELCRTIRRAVKEASRDAYLMGEHFFDASSQLQGDQWDGVMNYTGFSRPLLHWLCGYHQPAWGQQTLTSSLPTPTSALAAAWRQALAVLPWQNATQQLNLLTSHDTSRILERVGGDRRKHHLAAIVQFAFPGIPCIFYGDEIGMRDVPKYQSRGCMIWDQSRWDEETLQLYRRLAAFRRTSPGLIQGGFQVFHTCTDTIAFARLHAHRTVLVIAHRGDAPPDRINVRPAGIADGCRFRNVLGTGSMTVANGALPLPGLTAGALLLEQIAR